MYHTSDAPARQSAVVSYNEPFDKVGKSDAGRQICQARMKEMHTQFKNPDEPRRANAGAGYADSLHTNIPHVGSEVSSGIGPVDPNLDTSGHKKKDGRRKHKGRKQVPCIHHTVVDPVTGAKSVMTRELIGLKDYKTINALDLNFSAGQTGWKLPEFDFDDCFRQRRLQLQGRAAQQSASRAVQENCSDPAAGSSTDHAFTGKL